MIDILNKMRCAHLAYATCGLRVLIYWV